MSMIGEYYDEEILPPFYDKIKQAKQYLEHFISVMEGEGVATYYSPEKGVINIKEIKEFVKTLI